MAVPRGQQGLQRFIIDGPPRLGRRKNLFLYGREGGGYPGAAIAASIGGAPALIVGSNFRKPLFGGV